jgi:hypothetical protein
MKLYSPHSTPLTVLHAEIERYASEQPEVFVGTAGSIVKHRKATGYEYYARQFYDGDGRQREQYVAGPAGDPEAEAITQKLRGRIAELKSLVPDLRMLAREGYAVLGAKAYATLASLHNHKVFAAGAMLVGSHAFGALLNQLGVRAAPYATEDLDIARREPLAFESPPQARFLDMLRDSGVPFVEVPQLSRRQPATSFKAPGKSRFHVDLLVPSSGETYPIVAVPEVKAHATGLPYLKYLLEEPQGAAVLAREGCCQVGVPAPERFALHKLIVSQLRTSRGAKAEKDVFQASVLIAVLAERHPGALEEAAAAVPRPARKYLRAAFRVASPMIGKEHPGALAALSQAIA